ncbi:MAG: DUF2007 domain-containing protein [Candidatus Binatia bacterium]
MIRTLLLLAVAIAGIMLVRALLRPRALSSPSDDDSSGADEPLELSYDGSEELVALVSSADPVAIQAYRGALDSAGIPTVVFDEAASRMLGRLPTIAMRVMVPASRLSEARAVIDDFEPGTFSAVDET